MDRLHSKSLKLGNITIGGQDKVLLQSMCTIKTSKTEEVAAQINRCAALGADLMRVSVLDIEDALSISALRKLIHIPLVCDIHFDYRLALICLEQGAEAIRINPGNIGGREKVKAVAESALAHKAIIRVGVNVGSLEPEAAEMPIAEALVYSARKHVRILEDCGFRDIVISLKADNVADTIKAYRLASQTFPYPLHLGLTEAGPKDIGLIRSTAALAPLLLDGIGDTIRISLSEEPEEEIKAAARLLHDIGLYPDYPTLISCPSCGRTQVDLLPLAKRVQHYLEEHPKKVTVAVMGCVVNGPGEAKNADIGVAGGRSTFVLFKKGQVIKTIRESEAYEELVKGIEEI